jgi:iron complex transport system ATP-binding protein
MITIEKLSAGYSASTLALREVSLSVQAGEIAAVIGPNGCGKSTLLRCIAGLLPPRAGSVLLGQEDVSQIAPRFRAAQIALLPQQSEFAENLSVEELVLLGRTPHLSPYGAVGKHDMEIAERVMERTSTLAFRGRRVMQLSGGERQRVLLARALAQEPRVLLLDEPTSNLDLRYQFEILNLAYHLAKTEKLAVVVVLHQINLASSLADTVLLLNGDGSTRARGSAAEVMTRANLEAVYSVPLQISLHPETGRPQAQAGWVFGD